MKIFVVLILFCASISRAGDASNNTSDLPTKIIERNQDGRHLRFETHYRGKTPVLRIHRTTKEETTTTSRSYYVKGKCVMIESDENGDGVFEKVLLYLPGTDDMEIFIRHADGSMKPMDISTMRATRKQMDALSDAASKLLEKENLTDKDIQGAVNEAREKIKNAEKEKTPDKK